MRATGADPELVARVLQGLMAALEVMAEDDPEVANILRAGPTVPPQLMFASGCLMLEALAANSTLLPEHVAAVREATIQQVAHRLGRY